jgi:hypothetical protein
MDFGGEAILIFRRCGSLPPCEGTEAAVVFVTENRRVANGNSRDRVFPKGPANVLEARSKFKKMLI